MAQKDKVVRRVDEHSNNPIIGGGQLLTDATLINAPPDTPEVPPPEDVTVGTQVLLRTTLVPKVLVQLTWTAPIRLIPESYLIEYAENALFTTNLIRVTSNVTRAALEMKPNTDYWIRVQAIVRGVYSEYGYPTGTPSVHTIDDTTAPGEVSTVVTDWNNGDFSIKWTNPTSDNFFDARVRIYNTSGGILYKEVYIPGSPGGQSHYVFTAADNIQVTGDSPLTTLYYTIFARSIAHVLSPVGVSATVVKPQLTAPTGVTNTWSGDDGTYDEGVTITCNRPAYTADYIFTIDGISHTVAVPSFTYTYTQNVSEHRPTLVSGDWSLSYTVQVRDRLRLVSPGTSGTATNIAPQSSNLSLNYVAGFSSLYAYVTPTTDIKDLHHYVWTLASGGVTVQSVVSQTPEISFASLNGTYALNVAAVDMFGRSSNPVSASGIILDGLTIAQLRAETIYTNSLGTNSTTLASLKDGNILTSVITIASGTTWNWHKAERPLLDRYKKITTAFSGALTNMPKTYFGVSSDDSTYRWFAGPLTGTYSTVMTEYGSESSAQTNAIQVTNSNQYELPQIVEGRYIKMGHRGNTHNITEYYPRRLVQTDDLEVETAQAITVLTSAIVADKLSAITANIGQLVIDSAGYLWQGTGTPASPTTGLKIYQTSGIGRLTTWSGGIVQVDIDTNGRLLAGAGSTILDNKGIKIKSFNYTGVGDTFTDESSLRYINTSNAVVSYIQSYLSGTDNVLLIQANDISNTKHGFIVLQANKNTSTPHINIYGDESGSISNIDVTGDWVNIQGNTRVDLAGPVNVGNPTTPTTTLGDMKLAGKVQPGNVAVSYTANLVGSIANNGVAALGMSNFGFALLHIGGAAALFAINGSNHTTTEISDPSGVFSATAGTASSLNVYWSAGNSRYEIENKRGSTIGVRIWLMDA
jgi:hypothetical protein